VWWWQVGKANIGVMDRWGKTALDEARRVKAAAVVEYLEGAIPEPFH
jgi:hypothetical protein